MQCAVKGAIINYEVEGDSENPTVLLWHGAHCTLRMWDLVVPLIVNQFQVIRFDVRGAGLSTETENPDSEYCFEQYARDANSILAQCGVDQCHVWSMAWGSRAAIAYCSLFPERVISAAFNDGSIGPANVAAQKEGSKKALLLQQQQGIDSFPRPEGWNGHQHPESVIKSLAAAAKFDLTAAVNKLIMPVLVATGDHDPNLESSRNLVSLAPNAQLVVLENVGHGSVLQRPDMTANTFLEFHKSL